MKIKLGLLLLIAVGCADSTQTEQAAEIAKLQKQVQNLQKIAAEKAMAEKAAAEKTTLDRATIPAERRIMDELDSETRLTFFDQPLKDVVDSIKSQHNIPIFIDDRALVEVGLDSNVPVNFDLKGVSLRSGLKLMLNQLGLTYVINDEVLKITTPEVAENQGF